MECLVNCCVCHKQYKPIDIDDDTVYSKDQRKVCSQICQQYLQYFWGFAHGLLVFQVLSKLCGNALGSIAGMGKLLATSSSFSKSKPKAKNHSIHGNRTGCTKMKVKIEKKLQDVGRSDEEVTGLKVFFEKDTDCGQEATGSLSRTTGLQKTASESVKMTHCNDDKEIMAADCPGVVEGCSEEEGAKKTAVKEPLLKCSYCAVTFPPGEDQALTRHLCVAHPKEMNLDCDICGATFKTRGFVNRHKRNVHRKSREETDSKKFECDKCGKRFSVEEYLWEHRRRNHNIFRRVPLDCKKCGQSFKSKVLLTKHMTSKHEYEDDGEKNKFQCHQCNKSFPSNKGLQCHVQFAHSKLVTVKCAVCGLSFRNRIHLKRHKIKMHNLNMEEGENEKKTFRCDQCNKEFPSRKSWLQHVRFMHSKETPSDCQVCGKAYRNARVAKEHMRAVHRVKVISDSSQTPTLSCSLCPQTFCAGAVGQITNHVKEFHTKEETSCFSCDICGMTFKQKLSLGYHKKRKHSIGAMEVKKEKMHPCDKCGKTLFKDSMRRHILMFHSKHVPVDCKVCGKKVRSALHLVHHMSRSHSNQPSKVCDVCGAKLKTNESLKAHLAAHKGVKSHVCEICGAGFVRRTSWRRHVREHSHPSFLCDICAKTFTTDYALHTHMLNKHQQGAYFNNRLKTVEELGYTLNKQAVDRHLNHQCVICGENLVNGVCSRHPTDYMLTFSCNQCELKAKHIKFFCRHLKNHISPVKFASPASRYTRNKAASASNNEEAVMAFSCKVCHKSFQRQEYVYAHMKQHEEKTFSCAVCEKKFTYKCNLKSHLVTHSDNKPFQCDVCHKEFKRQEQLTCHVRIHNPNKSPFKCYICGKGLTRRQNLRQHYRLVHPELQVLPSL